MGYRTVVGLLVLTRAVQLMPRATKDGAGTGDMLDLLEHHPSEPILTHDELGEISLLSNQAQSTSGSEDAPAMKAFGPNAHISNTATFFNLIAIAFGIMYLCFPVASKDEPSKESGIGASQTQAATPEGQGGAPAFETSTSASPPDQVAKPKVRSAGMDNLKLLLTFLVIEVHVIQCFSTGASFWFNFSIKGDQTLPGGTKELPSYSVDNYFASEFVPWYYSMHESFCMALFFFLSGFFNPSSLDKKGRAAFLKDKFIRLGIPCLFWHFLMGPAWAYLMVTLTTDVGDVAVWYHQTYGRKFFQVGPPWFLLWLLNFNVIYAFAEGAVWEVPFPGVGPLLIFAFTTGVFQSTVPPGDFFIECPHGLHSLSVYAAFFMFGILAKRGAWLDALMRLEEGTVTFIRCLAFACTGLMYCAKSSERRHVTIGDVISDEYLSTQSFVFFLMGFQCVILSTVLVHYCLTSWTHTGFLMSNAMPARYAVYLIHPFFVIYGVAAYAKLLGMMNVGISIFVGNGPPGYIVESTNVIYMWAGFLFVSLFCFSTWPVAYALAKMPGLRNVL